MRGERTRAISSPPLSGTLRRATWVEIATPCAFSERASFVAATFAGSEAKLRALESAKPELKASPESGPM
jgi:hypothetical protein